MNDRPRSAGVATARPLAATRVADAVAHTLYAHGVRHAFGMPGGEVVTLVDALEAAGIRFVLTRHESAAAIAAAGTSLFTGAPGLLVTTLGPGLANAVNGVADAVQERMPLLVISGVVDRALRGRYTHQVLDHAALLRGAGVKASFEIEAEGGEAVVARAIRLALAPPCGPVHLDLAPGIAAAPCSHAAEAASPPARMAAPRPDPADPALDEMRRRLARAERPLVIAGFEAARDASSAAALAAFAERRGLPVITTYKAKGVVDETRDHALGAAGLSPRADAILLAVVAAADLVLLVGYDPIEMRPGWLDPFAGDAEIIALGKSPADHGMHRGDLDLTGRIDGLLAALDASDIPFIWPGGEPARARAALDRLFAPVAVWGPDVVIDTLQRVLPPGAVVTVDSGAHRILFSQQWRARRPLSALQSAGWCTMGSALPLALGASLAQPGRPIVAFLGDGGLEMTLGELGTLRDQGLPVVVLVLQDLSLALIALKQEQAGLAPAGVALGRTDFAKVADAFGGFGVTVRDAAALERAVAAALGRAGFSLIACEIEAASYAGRI